MKGWLRIFVLGGCVMVLLGLVWAGQGSGMFPYPRASFMVDDTTWIYKGLGFAALGAAIAVLSARRMRSGRM